MGSRSGKKEQGPENHRPCSFLQIAGGRLAIPPATVGPLDRIAQESPLQVPPRRHKDAVAAQETSRSIALLIDEQGAIALSRRNDLARSSLSAGHVPDSADIRHILHCLVRRVRRWIRVAPVLCLDLLGGGERQ